MARMLCDQEALPAPYAPVVAITLRLQTPRRPANVFVWVGSMQPFHNAKSNS